MRAELFTEGSNRPGFLVTVDGPNGSGKTYLTHALAAALRAEGAAVHSTRQPSPSSLGDFVRRAEPTMSGRALATLVAADRHHQVATEIATQLREGKIVLCDRYVESSLVLQRLDGVATRFILAINAGIPRPDLRLRLTASPAVIGERLASRQPDPERRFEQIGGPERELGLYAEADKLLERDFGLGAQVYDTSATEAEELGRVAADLVVGMRDG